MNMKIKSLLILALVSVCTFVQAQLTDYSIFDKKFNFYVANDLGRNGYYDQKPIAELMGTMGEEIGPEFVLATGDVHHFEGVRSVNDPLWMTNYAKIGSLTDGLVQVLNAVKNDYKKFKEEKNDNEFNQIMSFLYGKISIVGTPYEQDHISNIINEILGRLKKDTDNLKTVLLIDDFDRIDPEHTFRLLNIFASQCDPQSLRGMKFNFDHVIIVCDVNNIRYFFHHKYGMNTDFNGYIDKFYCKEIFNFDIKWKFIDKLKDFLSPLQSNSLIKPIAWEATKNVIEELINRGEINLRNAHRFNSISIKMESYIAADIIMNKTDPAVTMFNILSAVLSGEAELERIINKYNSLNLMYSTSSNLFYTAGILFHIIDHKNTKFRIGQGTSIANRIGNFCYSCKSFGDFREGYILRIMKIEEASTATAYSSDFFPFWYLMKTAYDSRKQYLISGEKIHN